jgi:hypothetical protein
MAERNRGGIQSRDRGRVELLRNQRRRALGKKDAVPEIRVEIGKSLLVRSCQFWQDRRTTLRQHRDGLDLITLDVRECDCRDGGRDSRSGRRSLPA